MIVPTVYKTVWETAADCHWRLCVAFALSVDQCCVRRFGVQNNSVVVVVVAARVLLLSLLLLCHVLRTLLFMSCDSSDTHTETDTRTHYYVAMPHLYCHVAIESARHLHVGFLARE